MIGAANQPFDHHDLGGVIASITEDDLINFLRHYFVSLLRASTELRLKVRFVKLIRTDKHLVLKLIDSSVVDHVSAS